MTIAVIGAGIQGCLAAIELEARGHHVVLFERHREPMTGASRWNEGKIHLGYLFAKDPSLRTARTLIDGATRFGPLMRRYLQRDLDFIERSSSFVYAVHRRSLIPPDSVGIHLGRVQALIVEAMAGTDRDYLGQRRLVGPQQTNPQANGLDGSLVAAAFATDEVSINPRTLANAIAERVLGAPRIEFLGDRTVAEIIRTNDGRFVVADAPDARHGPFDHVVNATWEERLGLDRSLGYDPPMPWIHRFKVALHLAPSSDWEDVASVTFVLGPFGDVVNFGSAGLDLSWYPVGRIGSSRALVPPPMAGAVDAARRDGVARAIVARLADLIPALAGFEPSETRVELNGGYIFAWGKTDIDDARSGLHRRYEIGVHSDRGYHSIDTGKLTMAPLNAETLGRRIGNRA